MVLVLSLLLPEALHGPRLVGGENQLVFDLDREGRGGRGVAAPAVASLLLVIRTQPN